MKIEKIILSAPNRQSGKRKRLLLNEPFDKRSYVETNSHTDLQRLLSVRGKITEVLCSSIICYCVTDMSADNM